MTAFRPIFVLLIMLCLVSCRTTQPIQAEWKAPSKPIVYPVEFVHKDDGLFINSNSCVNLWKNIEEMDAYTEKLEALVDEMKKYYKAK